MLEASLSSTNRFSKPPPLKSPPLKFPRLGYYQLWWLHLNYLQWTSQMLSKILLSSKISTLSTCSSNRQPSTISHWCKLTKLMKIINVYLVSNRLLNSNRYHRRKKSALWSLTRNYKLRRRSRCHKVRTTKKVHHQTNQPKKLFRCPYNLYLRNLHLNTPAAAKLVKCSKLLWSHLSLSKLLSTRWRRVILKSMRLNS